MRRRAFLKVLVAVPFVRPVPDVSRGTRALMADEKVWAGDLLQVSSKGRVGRIVDPATEKIVGVSLETVEKGDPVKVYNLARLRRITCG